MAPSSKDFPDQSKEVLSFQPPPPPAGRQRTREAGLAQLLGLAKASVLERPAWATAGRPDGCTPGTSASRRPRARSPESARLGKGQVGASSMTLGVFLGPLSVSTSAKCWAFVSLAASHLSKNQDPPPWAAGYQNPAKVAAELLVRAWTRHG